MMKTLRKICLYALCPLVGCFSAAELHAQDDSWKLLKDLKGLNAVKISYDYTVALVDPRTQRVKEDMRGKMFRLRSSYLDSSAHTLNIRDESCALQIRTDRRLAYLTSIREMEQRHKKKWAPPPNVLFDLNSMLEKNLVSCTSAKEGGGLRIKVRFRDAAVLEMTATLDQDSKLKKLVLHLPGSSDPSNPLLRVLTMEHFSEGFSAALLNTGRFLSLSGKKYSLKGSYKDFTLKKITI